MAKRILFRADSSSTIGLGHIKRDLVYASRLKKGKIYFASQDLQGNINNEIPYPIHCLKTEDINELIALCNHLQIDQLIIDNYALTYEDEKKIKKSCNLTLSVFDDTYEKHYCDEIINHNIGANPKKYINKTPPLCKISIIPSLIRDDFFQEAGKRRKREGYFLSLGGADSSNLTLKVLKAIKVHGIKVNVAITSSNPHLEKIKRYTNINRWVSLHIDANIAPLLNSSELAIITPSILASEAIFMGTPVLSITTASNQLEVERFLKKQRFLTLQSTQVHKLRNKMFLRHNQNYKKYFESRRADSFTLRPATLNDLSDLFDLANDPLIRKNSFSSKPISLETHTSWLSTVLNDDTITLYVLRSATHHLMAQLRFNRTEEKAIISISIDKNFRGKGLSQQMISLACERYLQTSPDTIIEAQIKEENIPSQKSFENSGFKLFKRKENILYYHLTKENYESD